MVNKPLGEHKKGAIITDMRTIHYLIGMLVEKGLYNEDKIIIINESYDEWKLLKSK